MLKYVNEMETDLNWWLKKNGFETETKFSTDFAYDLASDRLYFGIFIPTISANVWGKCLDKWGLNVDYGTFATCFLHELGHSQTMELLTDREYYFSEIMKKVIKILPFGKLQNKIYFSLPIEKIATKWAIDFMNENPKCCEELQKLAKANVEKFIKENNVCLDEWEAC